MLELKKLDWDSSFFELPVYALEVTFPVHSTELRKIVGEAEGALLYVYLKDDNKELHDLFVSQGALFFDTRIIYAKKLTQDNLCKSSVVVKEYNGALDERLKELAIQAGQYSRFKNDLRLKPYFDGLYKGWIKNSLNGELADKVFVYQDNEIVEGFATCGIKNGQGWTGLISVDVRGQGKGVGKSLMAAIEKYFLEKNIEQSLVITQEENIKACRFYESCGYEISQREFIYHWWL